MEEHGREEPRGGATEREDGRRTERRQVAEERVGAASAPRDLKAERPIDRAQQDRVQGSEGDALGETREGAENGRSEPDVVLDVTSLDVDEIVLNVSDLKARVALHASAGNLVALDVGADVSIERVELGIKGVHAQALLKVHLDRVYDVLARTLTTIDNNPDLLHSLIRPVGEAVGAVGRTLEETVPAVGEAVGRTAEQTVPELGRTVGETVKETVPDITAPVRTAVGEPVSRAAEANVPAAAVPSAERAAPSPESPARAKVEPLARPHEASSGASVREAATAPAAASDTGSETKKLGRRMGQAVRRRARRVAAGASDGIRNVRNRMRPK